MNDPINKTDYEDDIFSMSLDEAQEENHRIAVRYIRTDITAVLFQSYLFKPTKKIIIKLRNISSKGALIDCKDKLSEKKKVTLELVFKDQKKFIISSQVIHHENNCYGLKFDQTNNDLADYLLISQKDLIFK